MTEKGIADIVRRDVANICSIYPTVGDALYDEPRERLVARITKSIAAEIQQRDARIADLEKERDDLKEEIETREEVAWKRAQMEVD